MYQEIKFFKVDKYLYEVQLSNNKWINFNLLNFNYFIADRNLSQTDISKLDYKTIKILSNLGFILEIEEKQFFEKVLFEWIIQIKKEYNQNFELLVFRILPTLNCNFRCTYCYQPDFYQEETRKKQII